MSRVLMSRPSSLRAGLEPWSVMNPTCHSTGSGDGAREFLRKNFHALPDTCLDGQWRRCFDQALTSSTQARDAGEPLAEAASVFNLVVTDLDPPPRVAI
jgi:hypothetical protein